jgi:hypothetical protein
MLQVVCNVLLKVVCNVLFQVVAPSGTPGSLAVFKVMNPIRTSNQPWNAPSEPTNSNQPWNHFPQPNSGTACFVIPCIPMSGNLRGTGSDLVKHLLADFQEPRDPEPNHRTAPIDGQLFQHLADSLREWAPSIGGQHHANLVRYVQILQFGADEMYNPGMVFGHRQWAYPVECLINALLLSSVLKSQASLAEVCRRAIRLCFSTAWSTLWLQQMDSGNHVQSLPSASTLTRHKLTLHSGWMLAYMRQVNRAAFETGAATRYVTCDSSPQGGRDYLNSASLILQPVQISGAFAMMLELIPLAHRRRSDEDNHLIRERESALVQDLSKILQMQRGVSVCVGSGRSTVAHKLHALAHCFRLETSSWEDVASCFNSTIAFTTDFGVESLIVDTPRFHLNSLFPWAFEPDDGFHNEVGVVAHDAGVVDLSQSLGVIGLLHIIHNAVNDLNKSMDYFREFVDQLTIISRTLATMHSKQRLLQTCFASGAGLHYRSLIENWNGIAVYEGRWGTVAGAAQDLRDPVESALRSAWSLEKFSYGKVIAGSLEPPVGADHADANPGRIDKNRLVVLDAAFTSPLFWAYRSMMDNMFCIITYMMIWAEGCPCHVNLPELHGNTKYMRRKKFQASLGLNASCPLCTRRAACLSAGEFHAVLAELFSIRTSTIMVNVLPRLQSQRDRDIVLRDWERGRRAFIFTMTVKLAPWQQLPMLLCGGGHHNEQVARSIIRRAFAMFDELAAVSQNGSMHPLSLVFFDRASPLFAEVVMFMQGHPRSWLPNLSLRLGQLALTPVTERLVEGLHAVMHKHIRASPHHTVCHAALSMHLPEVKNILEVRPEFIETLAGCCLRTRTPMHAVRELGLHRHPRVRQILDMCAEQEHLANRHHGPELTNIVYHADLCTMFADAAIVPLDVVDDSDDVLRADASDEGQQVCVSIL